jgi:hypothetical protein
MGKGWIQGLLLLCMVGVATPAQVRLPGGGIPIIPPVQVPLLAVEQTYNGRTDLYTCTNTGSSQVVIDNDPAYIFKTYIGCLTVSGVNTIIYTRGQVSPDGLISVDLMSCGWNGSGRTLLASAFTSQTQPDELRRMVRLDTTNGRVIYMRSAYLPDDLHPPRNIFSVDPRSALTKSLTTDSRDTELKGVSAGWAIYELKWSATDTDVYRVSTLGGDAIAIAVSGSDDHVEDLSLMDTRWGQFVYSSKTSSQRQLWVTSAIGSISLGGGLGDCYGCGHSSNGDYLFFLRQFPTYDELCTQYLDGTGLVVLERFPSKVRGSFMVRQVGNNLVYPVDWNSDGAPVALKYRNYSGSGVSIPMYAPYGAPLKNWFAANGGTQLLVQLEDAGLSSFWVQNLDGSGRVNLAFDGWDNRPIQEVAGRMLYTRGGTSDSPQDLFSIRFDGSGLSTIASSSQNETVEQVIDGVVYYRQDFGWGTILGRANLDGTSAYTLRYFPGTARIEGWFYN